MTVSGPDPEGSGPESSPGLEAARRRLYGPDGGGEEAVVEYERLAVAAARSGADVAAPDGPAAQDEPPAPTGRPRAPRRRLLIACGAVAAAAILLVAGLTARPALPEQVEAPPLAGTTLLVYGRSLDPAVQPDGVTYQPEGYTVYRPRGRVVQVALRCIGEGTVRISAGAAFDFTCTDQESVRVRTDSRVRSSPFVIMGTTVGDVVWSARIATIAPPASFTDGCASCSASPGGWTPRTAGRSAAGSPTPPPRVLRCRTAPPATSPIPSGGATPSSTRCTRAASPTGTGTGSATSPA